MPEGVRLETPASRRETDSPWHHGPGASEGQPIKAQGNPKQDCSVFSVCPASAYQIKGTVNNTPAAFVLDTGAAVTLLSHKLWKQGTLPGHKPQPWDGPNLVAANGSPITVHGTDNVVLNIAGIDLPLQVVIYSRWTHC